jgi:hypothetical protein
MKVKCPICNEYGATQIRNESIRIGHYKGFKKTGTNRHTTIIEWHPTTLEAVKLLNPDIESILGLVAKKKISHMIEMKENEWFLKLGYEEQKNLLLGLIGKSCLICNSRSKLTFHEIHGKKHEETHLFVLIHKEDFVTLCKRCHLSLHLSSADNLDMFLQLREKINGKQCFNENLVNKPIEPSDYQNTIKSDERKIMSLAPKPG